MFPFSILMAIIWVFFLFYQLNGIFKHSGLAVFVLNFFSGVIFLFVFNRFNHQIGYLIIGGILLISGLRYLKILDKDVFYFAEKPLKPGQRFLVRQLVLFLCWLSFLSQWQAEYFKNLMSLFIFSLILAGLLQLLMWKRNVIKIVEWQKDLVLTLAGLFLVINSLIIMSGDVAFFLHILEKILHIN